MKMTAINGMEMADELSDFGIGFNVATLLQNALVHRELKPVGAKLAVRKVVKRRKEHLSVFIVLAYALVCFPVNQNVIACFPVLANEVNCSSNINSRVEYDFLRLVVVWSVLHPINY